MSPFEVKPALESYLYFNPEYQNLVSKIERILISSFTQILIFLACMFTWNFQAFKLDRCIVRKFYLITCLPFPWRENCHSLLSKNSLVIGPFSEKSLLLIERLIKNAVFRVLAGIFLFLASYFLFDIPLFIDQEHLFFCLFL